MVPLPKWASSMGSQSMETQSRGPSARGEPRYMGTSVYEASA